MQLESPLNDMLIAAKKACFEALLGPMDLEVHESLTDSTKFSFPPRS